MSPREPLPAAAAKSMIRIPMHTAATIELDLGSPVLETIVQGTDRIILYSVGVLFQAIPSLEPVQYLRVRGLRLQHSEQPGLEASNHGGGLLCPDQSDWLFLP